MPPRVLVLLATIAVTALAAVPAGAHVWLVATIHQFAGGSVNDGTRDIARGHTLTTAQAHALYDNWCRKEFAQGFLLYKLFTYAAAVTRARR